MKIIRKLSGFTTNSSASSEWIPPETDPADAIEGQEQSTEEVPPDSGTTQSTTVQPDQLKTPFQLPAWGKPLLSIGIVVILITGLFFLERIIRKVWKKIKGKGHEK
ncbi:MAG: hypothetical protein JXB88_21515 [Spirochaetales bacterium]|nr:hypothetical protein [Spirochaetales bacterium]